MTPATLAAIAGTWPWLAALLLLIVLSVMFAKYVWPILKKVSRQADDFLGEEARPGVARRPGVMERMQAQEEGQRALSAQQEELAKTLEIVRHEMFPNSGKSLRDKLDQTSAVLNRVHDKLDNDNNRIGKLTEAVSELSRVAKENHPDDYPY